MFLVEGSNQQAYLQCIQVIVTTGYVLGLQMPKSGHLCLTQSNQCHRTACGIAPSPYSLPRPHLVTLFSIVMDS